MPQLHRAELRKVRKAQPETSWKHSLLHNLPLLARLELCTIPAHARGTCIVEDVAHLPRDRYWRRRAREVRSMDVRFDSSWPGLFDENFVVVLGEGWGPGHEKLTDEGCSHHGRHAHAARDF